MKPIHALLAGTVLLLAATGAFAAAPGPIVVELFTSQGCSSCPPADALLGELSHRSDVLALAMHVTYWNDLGWEDKFSQARFDERQVRYVQQLRLRSSYTPQMVVNGAQDVVGSQHDAVLRAISKATPPADIGVVREGTALKLSLPVLERPCRCVLTLFGIRSNARTAIGHGENGGRTLEEFQVVRAIRDLGEWNGTARELQAELSKMPADVDAFAVVAQEWPSEHVVAAGR